MAPSDTLAYSSSSKSCSVSSAVVACSPAVRSRENAVAAAGVELLFGHDGRGFDSLSSSVWMLRENSLSGPDSMLRRRSGRGKKQRRNTLTQSCAAVTAKLHTGDEKKARLLDTVNRLIRTGTERVPLGGVPFGGALLGRDDISRGQDLDDDKPVGDEDERPRLDHGRTKNLLILMSETGGGHRASAEAIKATFELEYGDEYQVNIVDLWQDHCPWPWNQVPKTYSFMVKHEALWKLAYHSTYPRCVHQSQMAATSTFIARQVTKGFQKYKPDVIVSVHPLMQHVPLRILRAKGLLGKIPFTTVITDLNTCHPTWFHRSVNKCFCPTPAVEQRALQAGLRASQVRVHGLPIRPAFSRFTRPKAQLRKDLDLDDDLPAVLLMGGGEGMGPVEATARALLEALFDKEAGKPIGQLVVICGRNKKLVKKLGALNWKIPVKIEGFVSNMPEWMGACDCVISKAGPGTIAEAMICGLPMVLNSYIAGQEVGNVSFVVDNAAGKFSEKPVEIASIIADWFGAKSAEFKEAAQNAAKLGRPDAVFRIVHDIDYLSRNAALKNGTTASVWI